MKAAPALGAGLILDLLRRQGWGELVLLALCLSLGQERRGHVPCGYGSSWPWCSPVGHAGRGVSCRLVGVGGQPAGGLPAGRRAPSPQSCAPALLGVSQLIRGLEPMMAAIAWRGFQSVPEGGHMESGCASRLETQGVVLPKPLRHLLSSNHTAYPQADLGNTAGSGSVAFVGLGNT